MVSKISAPSSTAGQPGHAPEVREAVAIVIFTDSGKFLSVLRPANDPHLPDVWGLPAVNVAEGETSEQAAIRAARQKLGVTVTVRRRVGCETVARPSFCLHLTEYEVELLHGEPTVPQDDTTITQYVRARYTNDLHSLVDAARRGSACCRIFLRDRGIRWQQQSAA